MNIGTYYRAKYRSSRICAEIARLACKGEKMKLSNWRTCAILPGLLAPQLLIAQSPHTPSLAESLSRTSIRAPSIAPDAKSIAYLKRQTDWKENEFVWQLWLADVSTGRNIQLTRGRKSAGASQWSPDGRWLAFITERESTSIEPIAATKDTTDQTAGDADKPAAKQIWLIAPNGGEARPLTRSAADVTNFHWSRDGKKVLFTAAKAQPKSAKSRKEKYSDYEVVEKDFTTQQLWSVDVAAADNAPMPAQQLTSDLTLNVNSFAISPDSSRVAFSATHNPQLAFLKDEDIYLLDLSAGKPGGVKKIVSLPGPDRSPMFSADGKQLAFETSLEQPNFFYANTHLAVVDLATVLVHPAKVTADVRDLTKGFDENPQPLDWLPGGVYFGAAQKMADHLFRVDPVTLDVQRISNEDELLINDSSITPDGQTVAFIAESPATLTELYVSSTQSFAPKKLTDLTAQIGGWQLGSVEIVSWKSRDGTVIEGVLHRPADYDAKRKYPLLVKIHGGPTGVSQPRYWPSDYAYPVQAFLAKGALVLEPNYRGSAGYGAKFRALNVRNLGVGDLWDVMSGVDSLIAKGIVDPKRLGSMGWSQGGYISAFLTTHTDRFKAISVGAGISDWATYYVSTDITPFTPQYLQATPWDDPQIYAKTSPITTIKQAKTPTLIQHGSADRRVPVPDAFELYRGLLDQRVDSRLILYTGFGHGIDKPKSSLALLQANLDWFNHYIWNEPIPKDSALYGSSELRQDAE
jgi:dipeptidyl aminopeptidase/acylaminoacyl peptidase